MLAFLRQMLSQTPWLWVAGSVCLGGIIHILAVFSIPLIAERDAWGRLSAISTVNQMYVLPPVTEGVAPLPMMAPDVTYAFCRFDLTQQNVLLRLVLAEATWMVAIYGRYGENFYFLTGAEARRKDLRLLLVPRERLARETVTEKTEEGEEQIIVITPSLTGIVLVHAPVRGKAFVRPIIEAMQDISCEPQKETDTQLLASDQDGDLAREQRLRARSEPRKGTRNYR